jgi:ABC-type dipeptide/oligopeptide/nickel transport system permease subunit
VAGGLSRNATLITMVVGINLFADWLREELNPKI